MPRGWRSWASPGVRIGEFAWSKLEPAPGAYDFGWLDRAIEVLGAQGLKVVLGTGTATPPLWMLTRHYCFSHRGYRGDARIVGALAKRYGRNVHVAAWQADNEYGCHDTTLSYSPAARDAFRDWLAQPYQSPDALSRACRT